MFIDWIDWRNLTVHKSEVRCNYFSPTLALTPALSHLMGEGEVVPALEKEVPV
jgi:hypothetical protein